MSDDNVYPREFAAAADAEIAQLRARVAELEAALRPFAEWYKTYTEENIAAHAVLAYRRAAELLK